MFVARASRRKLNGQITPVYPARIMITYADRRLQRTLMIQMVMPNQQVPKISIILIGSFGGITVRQQHKKDAQ